MPELRDEPEAPAGGEQSSYLREVWKGVRWITADRRLVQVLVSGSITMTLIAALMTVIMPVYADAVFEDPVHLGVLVADFGLGSLIGSTGFGYLAERLAGWTTYVAATALIGLPFILLSLTPPLIVATLLGALIGVAFGPIVPSMDTPIQQRTHEAIRGRVFSTRFALNSIIKLPGLLVIGVALETAGLVPSLVALGALAVCIAAYLVLRRTDESPVQDRLGSPAYSAGEE